jgi:hypothetical protein
VLPYLANERDSAPRIVERDVVADLLQVNFGLWREARAHSLRAVFGHLGVLALQTMQIDHSQSIRGDFRFFSPLQLRNLRRKEQRRPCH